MTTRKEESKRLGAVARRQAVARLRVRFYSGDAIARMLGVSPATISRDIAWLTSRSPMDGLEDLRLGMRNTLSWVIQSMASAVDRGDPAGAREVNRALSTLAHVTGLWGSKLEITGGAYLRVDDVSLVERVVHALNCSYAEALPILRAIQAEQAWMDAHTIPASVPGREGGI